MNSTQRDRYNKIEAIKKLYNINDNLVVRISWSSGYIEIPYVNLLVRPLKGFKRERDWEIWVRKIISIAIKNGGWKLIHRKDTNNENTCD